MKTDLFLLKYGELALKGLNKPAFEKKLLNTIKRRLSKLGNFSVRCSQSTIYVEPLCEIDTEEVLSVLSKIFGIANICPVVKCEKDLDEIEKTAVELIREYRTTQKTFKVESKR